MIVFHQLLVKRRVQRFSTLLNSPSPTFNPFSSAKDEASRAKQRAEAIEFVRAGCSVEKYTHAGGGKPHKRFMAVKVGHLTLQLLTCSI